MSEYRIVTAKYDPNGVSVTEPVYKGNYGNVLRLVDFPEGMIPETFEMHFSVGSGNAKTQIGTNNEVQILDECLTKAVPITAWLFLHDAATDGETKHEIRIPVKPKDNVVDEEPTPVEQSVITQAIAALNDGVERAEAAQEAAEEAQEAAEAAADRAEQAATDAHEAAQTAAEDAVEEAEQILEGYKQAAEEAATRAGNSATDANASREAADVSATNAGISERNAKASEEAAEQVVSEVEGYARTAGQKATQASNYADYASASAREAQTAAQTAGTKAGEASASADTAGQKAQEAASSAMEASQAADDAEAAEAGAETAKTNAESAATDAAGSASAARASAENAGGSATAAAGSATAAAGSATAAEQSASQAANTVSGAVTTINAARDSAVTAVQNKGDEVLESIPADYSALTEEIEAIRSDLTELEPKVDSLQINKADVIISSASGAIASFSDGADGMPVKELTVAIEPVQDLHGYDSPWPAGGGKNIIPYPYNDGDSKTQNGITFTVNNDGSVKVQGTATASTYFNMFGGGETPIPSWIKPNTAYYLQPATSSGKYFVQFILYGSTNYAQTGGRTFTTPADLSGYTACAIIIGVYNGAVVNDTIYPMLEYGTTASARTPYSNICPISGHTAVKVTRTGKNLCSSELGRYLWSNGTRYTNYGVYCATSDKVPIVGGQTYIISFNNTGVTQSVYVAWYCNGAYINQDSRSNTTFTFTAPDNATECTITIRNVDSYTGDPTVSNLQLELGSTATDYEPYSGQTYSIALPSEAGTVYGGELTVNEDGTGTLVANLANVDMGTLNWSKSSSTSASGGAVFVIPLANIGNGAKPRERYTPNNVNSDKYATAGTSIWFVSELPDFSITLGTTALYIADSRYEIAQDFKNANIGTQLVYELATPVTYTLTASQVQTLLGTNNVWSDAGDVEITYRADTKLYIDNKITQAIAAALNS